MSEELKTPEMLSLLDETMDDSVEQLTEQLSVIKEVRSELVKTYSEMNDIKKQNESLQSDLNNYNKEFVSLNSNIESLNKELNAYKARDAEVERLNTMKRLEQLSANFRALGQDRTVEELSKLDKAIVSEFESITKLALERKSSERLDAVTVPTQAMNNQTKKAVATPKQNGDFFKGMCNVLQSEQSKTDRSKLLYL